MSRELQSKFDAQIRDLTGAKEEACEGLLEAQSSLETLQQKFDFESQRWTEAENSLKKALAETKTS